MNLKILQSTNINPTTFRRDKVKTNGDRGNYANSNLEKSPNQDCFEMSIGYVNDTHGQTNNMMRILSGLKGDLRLSAGDNDIGDEKNKAIHKATYKFLNIAGVTATALGNHEMDATQADLIDSMKDYNGDVLTINMSKDRLDKQDPKDVKELGREDLLKSLKPSKIVKVKGENVGLLGTAPIDLQDRLTHPTYHTDCHVHPLDESIQDIQKEVDNLKSQGVNKIVLLSHLGHKKDKAVAQQTDGIDVIIGGHTHELVRDIKEGENLFYTKSGEPVILTEAGRDGNYFGLLNLEFDKNGVITKAQNNLGETGLFHRNIINQYIFNGILGEPENVGYVKEALPPPKSLTEENPHANFVCDVMKEETDSDIAIWHNCGVRNFFHEGELNSRDVKDISPFLDFVAVAEVSEKTIVDLFKQAIRDTYSTSSRKPGLFAVSGLNYTVNTDNGTLAAMNFIDKQGKIHSIDVENPSEDKKYKVVTDEFLMSAGADFKTLAPEEDYIKKYSYDKDVMVCNYLKKHREPIIINQLGRINYTTDNK